MAHGDTREWKWRGNWRMEWVASTLHTTSEHGVFSITTTDAHTSAASSRLNWRPAADLNWLVHFADRRSLVLARVPSHFKSNSYKAFRSGSWFAIYGLSWIALSHSNRIYVRTTELHLSGLIGTARHPDMQKVRIIGLLFGNTLHCQSEVRLLLFTVCTCVGNFPPCPIHYNNIYLLQLVCQPVAVVILHVYKMWNWLLLNLSREGYMRSMQW